MPTHGERCPWFALMLCRLFMVVVWVSRATNKSIRTPNKSPSAQNKTTDKHDEWSEEEIKLICREFEDLQCMWWNSRLLCAEKDFEKARENEENFVQFMWLSSHTTQATRHSSGGQGSHALELSHLLLRQWHAVPLWQRVEQSFPAIIHETTANTHSMQHMQHSNTQLTHSCLLMLTSYR